MLLRKFIVTTCNNIMHIVILLLDFIVKELSFFLQLTSIPALVRMHNQLLNLQHFFSMIIGLVYTYEEQKPRISVNMGFST